MFPSEPFAQAFALENLHPYQFMETESEGGNGEELCDGAWKWETIPLDGEYVQPQSSSTRVIADEMRSVDLRGRLGLSQSLSFLPTGFLFPSMVQAQVVHVLEVCCSLRRDGTSRKRGRGT